MDERLKTIPCRFCGSAPEHCLIAWDSEHPERHGWWSIDCNTCRLYAQAPTYAAAIAMWNAQPESGGLNGAFYLAL